MPHYYVYYLRVLSVRNEHRNFLKTVIFKESLTSIDNGVRIPKVITA